MKKNRSVYAGVLCGVLVAALILSGLFVTTHREKLLGLRYDFLL